MRLDTHPAQSAVICRFTLAGCALGLAVAWKTYGMSAPNRAGVAFGCTFAALVWLARAATGRAAIAGGILAATLASGTAAQPDGGWWRSALPALIALVACTLASTRFRRSQKEQLGLAESKSGRGASQVCANLGVAGLTAALALAGLPREVLLMAAAAALVEATADTVSSEMGQALPGRVILVTSGRVVPAGTDGGISLAGTLLGCAAGAGVAAVAAICLGLHVRAAIACWLAGIAGIFFDSWLGATLERRSILGNDAVNFSSTAFSALLGAALAHFARV